MKKREPILRFFTTMNPAGDRSIGGRGEKGGFAKGKKKIRSSRLRFVSPDPALFSRTGRKREEEKEKDTRKRKKEGEEEEPPSSISILIYSSRFFAACANKNGKKRKEEGEVKEERMKLVRVGQ